MADLALKGVRKSYGPLEVIHGVDLEIRSGEFVVFVGPSGCGKSTLLRMIAGLERITGGTVSLDGQVINQLPAVKRGMAMVFQSYALYPHMTVFKNMAFSLRLAHLSRRETEQRVREAARSLQIEPLLDRLPKELSGGQRQRVAIGRAIVRDPKVFLFDEPLSNLDAALRVATRLEIAKLHERMSATMIYVTHDQVEAMTLADRIVVLNGGVVEQVGTATELYETPTNLFVARFIGSPAMNILPARTVLGGDGAALEVAGRRLPLSVDMRDADDGAPVTLGIRPEDLALAPAGSEPDGANGTLTAKAQIIEEMGEYKLVHAALDGLEEMVVVKADRRAVIQRHEAITIGVSPDGPHVFDADGRAYRRRQHGIRQAGAS